MFDIIETLVEKDIPKDFVALGVLLDNHLVAEHAALIIQYKSKLYQCHYLGSVEFNNVDDKYFHKRTLTIVPDEVPGFIAFCKRIEKKANPRYGYFYGGEFYNEDGEHFSETSTGGRMTCVGFCLNVMKGWHGKNYIQYQDWDTTSHSPKYLDDFAEKNNLKVEDIILSHRRITPIELITSGYFNDLPITKKQIEERIVGVEDYFKNSGATLPF